jgi:hypothetical protein
MAYPAHCLQPIDSEWFSFVLAVIRVAEALAKRLDLRLEEKPPKAGPQAMPFLNPITESGATF